jgi:hypothetical protein
MTVSPKGTVIALMARVLGSVFGGTTWSVWTAVLKAAFALALTDDERAVVTQLTQRHTLPSSVRELWLLLGRRSGKSIIAALLAVWATCCRSYRLAPGEVGIFMIVAADRRQSRIIKRYISGLLRAHPSLEALIESETADAIWLTNGLCIEIHTCSYRSLRGYTCIGAAVDEVAFWDSDDSANPDKEVLVALRAAMASVPEAMLIALTSVYARRGEVWRIFEKYFGNNDSADVLVVNGPTRTMNPTIDEGIIATAYEDDPIAAAAEYGAEFRRDVEVVFPFEAVDAVRIPGRFELPYQEVYRSTYRGGGDPAGGSGGDSMTGSVAHAENGRAVLDAVWEIRPPFSPEFAVKELAENFKRYGLTEITCDRYAGDWPVEAFRKHGITVKPSERTRSEIYLAVLPMIMSGQVELLDQPRLLKQLASLERRKGRQGKDTVDAPPRQHEDVSNAACLALTLAGLARPHDPSFIRMLLTLGADEPRTIAGRLSMDSDGCPRP